MTTEVEMSYTPFGEIYVLNEVLRDSAPFQSFYRANRRRITGTLHWTTTSENPMCFRPDPPDRQIIFLPRIPAPATDAAIIAHEMAHAILNCEGMAAPYVPIGTSREGATLAQSVSELLHVPLIVGMLAAHGFDVLGEWERYTPDYYRAHLRRNPRLPDTRWVQLAVATDLVTDALAYEVLTGDKTFDGVLDLFCETYNAIGELVIPIYQRIHDVGYATPEQQTDVLQFILETYKVQELSAWGYTSHATDPQPIFAKYPGDAPGQGNQTGSIERVICQNATHAYFLCGLYGAMEDGWFTNGQGIGRFAPRVTITVPGSYDVLDFYGEWIEFDFALRLRGLDLSAYRYELVRASVTYDGGTANCVFELQAETFGEPGVNDEPESSDTSGLTDWTDIWGTITFPTIPEYQSLLQADTARLWHIQYRDHSAGEASLVTTEDSYQTETETTYASLGIGGIHAAAQQDPFNPSRLWVITDEEIGIISDIAGTPAYTLGGGDATDLGLAMGDDVIGIWMHTNIAAANFVFAVVVVDNSGTFKNYFVTTRDGVNWTSVLNSNNLGGIVWVSAHKAGRVFVVDRTATEWRIRKSEDYGASWTTIHSISAGSAYYGWHFPYANNADDGVFYFGVFDGFGISPQKYDHGVVTSLDSVHPNTTTGNTEISGVGLRGIDTFSSDPNILAMIGLRFGHSFPTGWALDVIAGGYTYSNDGAASFSPASVGNTRYRGIAISGNDPDVRWTWGSGGLVEKTIDGVNWTTLRDETATTLMDDGIVDFGGLP